jgi:hypothetical protein
VHRKHYPPATDLTHFRTCAHREANGRRRDVVYVDVDANRLRSRRHRGRNSGNSCLFQPEDQPRRGKDGGGTTAEVLGGIAGVDDKGAFSNQAGDDGVDTETSVVLRAPKQRG